jgi:hypothetical protein
MPYTLFTTHYTLHTKPYTLYLIHYTHYTLHTKDDTEGTEDDETEAEEREVEAELSAPALPNAIWCLPLPSMSVLQEEEQAMCCGGPETHETPVNKVYEVSARHNVSQ